MATRHGRSKPFARLRCDALEPRENPAPLDFGAGFTPDRLPGGLPAGYAAGDLLLTDGPHQARAVWAPTPVDVRAFQTSFVFQPGEDDPTANGSKGDGLTFALASAPPPDAGAAGAGLGYAGIADSVAVKFDLVDNAGEGADSVGVFTGGAEPTTPAVDLDGTGILFHSGHPVRADLAYDGAVLAVTLTDTIAPDRVWTGTFPVDIPGALGATTGYAGFTAGTGELFARQAVRSWTYVEGRPPTITGMHAQYTDDGGVVVLWATATDEGGAGGLTYTWAVVSTPPGGTAFVSPSVPGYSDARTYLSGTGPYTFRLTVRDAAGQTTTGELVFDYDPRYIQGLELTPEFATVQPGGTVQFTAVVRDQFGEPMPDVDPDWEVFVGPGTITSSGLYTAPPDVSGDVAIQAQVPIGPSRYQNFIFKYATVRIESTRPPEPPVDYGGGFAGADLLQNGSARVVGDRLRLADGPFQAGSAFAPTPVELNRQFVTRFQFQVGDAPDGSYGDGLTFVLQGDGPDALGAAGGGLGYAGIPNSVAVKFDLVDNAGEGTDTTGMYTNGAEPMVTAEGSNVALHSGHLFQVEARYDGHNLTVVLEDTVTGGYHIGYYKVDLAAVLGGTHAYAGFTAGTGELFAPIDILDWKYASTDNWDVTTIRM